MNGRERILAALEGRQPDRVPILLHNFMMAAREQGVTMERYRSSSRAVADSFLRTLDRYDVDGVLVDIDTATLAGAVGVPVHFPGDEPARCTQGCLASLEEVEELRPPDISNHPPVSVWLEAVRLLRDAVGEDFAIRGNCDQCPFSLAGMMRTPIEWMIDLTDPENTDQIHRLLEYCSQVTGQFLRLMAQAGAHVLSNGDSPAGPEMISPEMYREFALPYEKQICGLSHRLGRPYVLHICGRTEPILENLIESGADGLEFDQRTDAAKAATLLSGKATFIGNIDPSSVLALGTADLVRRKTRELLEVFRGNPRFILNAGCAIPAATPAENIRAMIETARSC